MFATFRRAVSIHKVKFTRDVMFRDEYKIPKKKDVNQAILFDKSGVEQTKGYSEFVRKHRISLT